MTEAARRLLWPGLMTVAMLIVLLALGTWQLQRLFWKQALLAQIDRAEAAKPVPLGPEPSPFTILSVTGEFLPEQSALYGAEVRATRAGPAMGARLIVPFRDAGGTVVLVDRGWIPVSRPGPIDQPTGLRTISGYVRHGDQRGWFSARDDAAERHFFTLDPKAIAGAVGQPGAAPFILVVLDAQRRAEDPWPEPARHLPRPPNSHLYYTITWYGLALALLAIFCVWAKKGRRA